MILMVEHRVTDWDAWKRAFDGHRHVQERYGATGYLLYRREDDPDVVTVTLQFPSREQLQGFMNDPSLAEAMERGGVVGIPQIRTYTEAGAFGLFGAPGRVGWRAVRGAFLRARPAPLATHPNDRLLCYSAGRGRRAPVRRSAW